MKHGGRSLENLAQLRARLEQLKPMLEGFVVAGERGAFWLVALFPPLLSWFVPGEWVEVVALSEA